MSETLEFPTIDADAIVKQSMVPAETQPLKNALAPATDLSKIDLTDVALAMYGKWPEEVAAVKSNLSTLVLDLSTPSKIKEARALRSRLILDPLAAARKVSAGIKSKMAQTSKAVGAELEKIVAAYDEADALLLPKIEEREAELEREREEKARIERERVEKYQADIARIRRYAERADTEPGMTSDRVAIAIQHIEALATPTSETWQEFALPAADAICWTLERLRITHARLLRAEQAEAEAAELRRRLEATAPLREPEAQVLPAAPLNALVNHDAPPQSAQAAEAGTRLTGAPSTEYPEGQASQQVLKAEPATADATDRDAPADASPRVGAMGAGQAADAAPAGGSPELRAALDSLEKAELAPLVRSPGPITMVEPAGADPRDELLREALALTKYAAAPFFSKFPTHPKTTPEWWAGLRERIEALQPKINAHLEGLA